MAANRILTSSEKQSLKNDGNFQACAKQAIEDQSIYWIGQNGVNLATEALSTRWAKSRHKAALYINQPESINSELARITERFIMYLKDWNLWDNAVNGNIMQTQVVVDFLYAQSLNGAPSPATSFSALADKYFDEEIKGILM